jgi:hypothetical protein
MQPKGNFFLVDVSPDLDSKTLNSTRGHLRQISNKPIQVMSLGRMDERNTSMQ